jgi:hypothetical protein
MPLIAASSVPVNDGIGETVSCLGLVRAATVWHLRAPVCPHGIEIPEIRRSRIVDAWR